MTENFASASPVLQAGEDVNALSPFHCQRCRQVTGRGEDGLCWRCRKGEARAKRNRPGAGGR